MSEKQITTNKLAIIDGDSLCYLSSKDDIYESIECLDTLIAQILAVTGSTSYYLFLSEGKYFRHKINNEYKNKRKPATLKYIKTLKNYLKEQYLGESWKEVEADDAVAYTQQKFLDGYFKDFSSSVVVAIDKDVKRQVEGVMFDYKKHEFSKTTKEEALYFIFLQALTGDSTDGIQGIPGIGPVKAEKILKDKTKNKGFLVFQEYVNYYPTLNKAIEEFQKNFKQIYILRTDEDFLDAVGYIPTLKSPVSVIE